jgi:hypothetical protein
MLVLIGYWQDHTDACGVFDKAHAHIAVIPRAVRLLQTRFDILQTQVWQSCGLLRSRNGTAFRAYQRAVAKDKMGEVW